MALKKPNIDSSKTDKLVWLAEEIFRAFPNVSLDWCFMSWTVHVSIVAKFFWRNGTEGRGLP
jgi:mannose-1-phosphate guanylyltransferase